MTGQVATTTGPICTKTKKWTLPLELLSTVDLHLNNGIMQWHWQGIPWPVYITWIIVLTFVNLAKNY